MLPMLEPESGSSRPGAESGNQERRDQVHEAHQRQHRGHRSQGCYPFCNDATYQPAQCSTTRDQAYVLPCGSRVESLVDH